MKWLARLGMIILVIGLSILASSFYRSGSTENFNYSMISSSALEPGAWNYDVNNTISALYLLPPRTLKLDVNSNSTIKLYIVDEEGLKSWASTGKLKPAWSSEVINQETHVLQIDKRDKYAFLIFNPENSAAYYDIHTTIYGFEMDLLWSSIVLIIISFTVTVGSTIYDKIKKS
jgi:hypothetical protein